MEPPSLYERMYAVVRQIPAGQVASYSMVAAGVGMRRGARVVGWALAQLPPATDVPWWRVVNARGLLTITNRNLSADEQQRRLEGEGVTCVWRDGMYALVDPVWWQA